VWSGEVWAFIRRDVQVTASPPRLMLLEPPHSRLPIVLADVSDGIWGFILFDEHSCQLHPNDSGQPPATLAVERDFAGQRRFRAEMSLPAKARHAVRFSFQVRAGANGECLGHGDWVVAPGRQALGEVALPPLFGRYRIALSTEMAKTGADSFHAWAHWLKPHFM